MTTRLRPRSRLLVLIFLAIFGGACAGAGAEVAGVTITTSTTAGEPVAIDDFVGLEWLIGGTYVTEEFLVPLSFSPERGGWLSRGADRQWAELWFDAEQDGQADATLTFLAHRPETDPEELVTEILRIDGVRQLTPTVERTIGGLRMLVVDVEGDPEPQTGSLSECSRPASGRFTTEAGYELFEDDASYGIPACHESRLWIVPVDGQAITVVGVAEDDRDFDDLMDSLERLLDLGLTFGTDD